MLNLSTQLKKLLSPNQSNRSGVISYGSARDGYRVVDDISGTTTIVYGSGALVGDTVFFVGDRITQVLGPATTTIVTV